MRTARNSIESNSEDAPRPKVTGTAPPRAQTDRAVAARARAAGDAASGDAAPRVRPLRLRIYGWLRWVHIYLSMFSLLAILFFSLTGITLNHPEWAFNDIEKKQELKGQLPPGWKDGQGVKWYVIDGYLRQTNGVHGTIDEKDFTTTDGSVTYKAPGYTADCFFDAKTGKYDLTVTSQGFVAMMNDFHRGNNTSSIWRRLIDVSGIFLTIVALTGLALLYYLKKIRVAALMAMGVGIVLMLVLMKLAA